MTVSAGLWPRRHPADLTSATRSSLFPAYPSFSFLGFGFPGFGWQPLLRRRRHRTAGLGSAAGAFAPPGPVGTSSSTPAA